MGRVLLADASPHAQRMGERILREEGIEVVTVTDGETAAVRLLDADPDVVLADVSLPKQSGYDICQMIKSDPRLRHIRVVLTAGLLDQVDEARAIAAHCDAMIRKPYEASLVIETVRPLIAGAQEERPAREEFQSTSASPLRQRASVRVLTPRSAPAPADPEAERVRAAVTLALDAALPAMIDSITEQVLVALKR